MQASSSSPTTAQQATASGAAGLHFLPTAPPPLFPLINALQNLFLLLEDDAQFESLVEMEKLRRSFQQKQNKSPAVVAARNKHNKENDKHGISSRKRAPPPPPAAAAAAHKRDTDSSSPSSNKKMKAIATTTAAAAATTRTRQPVDKQSSPTMNQPQREPPVLYQKKPGNFQQQFDEKFLEAQEFLKTHGHLPSLKENPPLFHWLKNNKSSWKKSLSGHKTTLTRECIDKLILLGLGTSDGGPTVLYSKCAKSNMSSVHQQQQQHQQGENVVAPKQPRQHPKKTPQNENHHDGEMTDDEVVQKLVAGDHDDDDDDDAEHGDNINHRHGNEE